MKKRPQRILVFQQDGLGSQKIKGIERFGGKDFHLEVVSIDALLPPVIEDGRIYLPDRIEADLVLDFLKHPDLTEDLASLCQAHSVPVVASGKKIRRQGVLIPPT